MMENIIIKPKNKKEFVFISEMLKKMSIEMDVFSTDKEDFALGIAIEEGMKTKTVSKADVLKALRK